MADTIKTNLGPVTAYADAKAHGYTGTREEFGALLANAGLNLKAAETAKEGAEAAKQAAETSQQAAAENQKNAETQAANAKASADTAAEQADAAKESATGAANSASAAQESETNAGLSATAAANAEAAAKQAQQAAETAKTDAEAAKTAAGTSADAAANSAADAKKTLESIPADYSTLSGMVDENANGISELKEDLVQQTTEIKETLGNFSNTVKNIAYSYLKETWGYSPITTTLSGTDVKFFFSPRNSINNNGIKVEIGKTYNVHIKFKLNGFSNIQSGIASLYINLINGHLIEENIYKLPYHMTSNNYKGEMLEADFKFTIPSSWTNDKCIPSFRLTNIGANTDASLLSFDVENFVMYEESVKDLSIFESGNFLQTYVLIKKEIVGGKKKIVCFGDSLTMGNQDGTGITYPSVLQSLLGDKYEVINKGVGGESGDTIGCRQGGITAYLAEDIESTYGATVKFIAQTPYGVTIKPSRQGSKNDGYINGHKGIIGFDETKGISTFTPYDNITKTWTAKVGTPILMGYDNSDTDIEIVCLGQNGVANVNVNPQTLSGNTKPNYEIWCDFLKTMQAYSNKKFIVLSLPTAGGTNYDTTVDAYAKKVFGGSYICVRQELVKYGLEIAGLTATEDDTTAIQNGKCPPSLMCDTIHLNQYGYKALATIIYWHLIGLGLVMN